MQPLEWLYSLEGRGSVLGLDRTKELLEKLGNPEKSLKCIHIAGTNGKGSVCAILSSILEEAGYKTGMYTSPHLKRFTERMQVNGNEIEEKRLNELIEKIKPHVTNQTVFEVSTAIAFQYFYEEKVDILVLEVGLGGRLDATNVITPLISIITNISLEHTQILGETEEEIAYEKAGIIKENVPVVTLAKGNALGTIKKIAKEMGSKTYIPKKYHKSDGTFDINSYKGLKLSLRGEFQLENASNAITSIDILNKQGHNVSLDSVRKGLEKAHWPGRFEFIEKNVLVDCAHNPAGVTALKKEIEKIRKNYEKVITVTGILKDKDKRAMVKTIEEFSDYIIFTEAKTDRKTDAEELSKLSKKMHEIVKDAKKALKKAKKIANKEDLIIVTGSIYIVGEVE